MSSWVSSLGLGGFLKRSRSESAALTDQTNIVPHKPGGLGCLDRQGTSLDLDLDEPQMKGKSEILRLEDICKLSEVFPPRLCGTEWRLVFSTGLHGFSLNSLYRRCQDETSPTLLVIQDTKDCVFGALMSSPLKLCEHFYGTGESFLFTCQPQFRWFAWSGENQLFSRGNIDSFLVGAGDGRFGLYVDSSLYQGRTQSCETYNNDPLTPAEDFVLKKLECWTFA